jgi:hypothetical protein
LRDFAIFLPIEAAAQALHFLLSLHIALFFL